MLGLRLRYQIAGFLFALFSIVVVIMGYFNYSILKDQLEKLTLHRINTSSLSLFKFISNMIPFDSASLRQILEDRNILQEINNYVTSEPLINSLDLLDSRGKCLFKSFSRKDVSMNDQDLIRDIIKTRKPHERMIAVDLNSRQGAEIDSAGIFDPRLRLMDYYYPIIREEKLIGIAHFTFNMEKISRGTQLFFIGNLSLVLVFIITALIAVLIWSENAINRPIRFLLRAQQQLSRGDFDAHINIELPSQNELYIIANSFNQMADELKSYKNELEDKSRKLQKINEEYRKLNENLENKVSLKTREQKEFFSLITHDLKIPLSAIKGYIALLQKEKTGPLNEKQERFIRAIEASNCHLLAMVKNMLDSVKYEDGNIRYFMEDFDLIQLLKEVESQMHPLFMDKGLNIMANIPENCRLVYGDKAKIAHVFLNILNNAVEYLPDSGQITISARENLGIVEIRIEDNGKGIPEDQLPIIFEKFKQIPGKESPSTSLGLGLYIVKKIIEGHGTETWAESEEGKGSRFYFTLKKGIKTIGEGIYGQ